MHSRDKAALSDSEQLLIGNDRWLHHYRPRSDNRRQGKKPTNLQARVASEMMAFSELIMSLLPVKLAEDGAARIED